ncbi:ATP-grasp fold amidoligase family protein [Flavicella sp.]|uniref:ATP-grasp fold amidoligase family protein n=1 Tax=Flavicella sp. TaxID=2957742 RepID=UPI003016C6A7
MKKAIKRKILKRYEKYRNRIGQESIKKTIDKLIDFLYPYEDEKFIKSSFKSIFTYSLDLDKPVTFNEKLQWLKLNDRKDLHTICADKLLVRNYVSEKIGDKYLIPLIFSTKKISDISPKILPDYPTIIKTNHDSGSTFIIRDKKEYNWKELKEKLKASLHNNFYFASREWPYKNIPPRIIVEKLLIQKNGKVPNDYRFYCTKGKVNYIQLEIERESSHSRNIYDLDWNILHITRGDIPSSKKIAKPRKLKEMISLCKKLSSPFIFARVDLYYINDEKIFFGEITFYPGGALTKFHPNKWDKIFGDMIHLPINN